MIASIKAGEEPGRNGVVSPSATGPTLAEVAERHMREHVAVRCKCVEFYSSRGRGYSVAHSIRKTPMGTERRDGMRGIGPEVKSDTIFRRRMRRHQGWYRDHVLGVPYGRGPNRRQGKPLGNMLTKASAELGLNFLTWGIFEVAKRRIDKGTGAVDPYRLLHNMLSSQPMCFNLFGNWLWTVDWQQDSRGCSGEITLAKLGGYALSGRRHQLPNT